MQRMSVGASLLGDAGADFRGLGKGRLSRPGGASGEIEKSKSSRSDGAIYCGRRNGGQAYSAAFFISG